MTKRRKVVLAILSLIALSAIAFLAGLAAGYYVGLGEYAGRDAPASAVYTVGVLNKLREGNVAAATSSLETMLDGDLMTRWAYDQRGHFLTSLL
jgi:hypothetical protein